MATQTIDATIFASSHPDIVKRTSLSGVIFSGLILLVGVLAFVSTFEMEDRSSMFLWCMTPTQLQRI